MSELNKGAGIPSGFSHKNGSMNPDGYVLLEENNISYIRPLTSYIVSWSLIRKKVQ